jgi:PAT family beta-lactamase induction signal transducer AmpG
LTRSSDGPAGVPAHPIVFLFLIAPFGAMSGYLTVAVAYLLSQAGLSVEQIAEVIAVSYLPQTWKFLWAPIADTTLTRKT